MAQAMLQSSMIPQLLVEMSLDKTLKPEFSAPDFPLG